MRKCVYISLIALAFATHAVAVDVEGVLPASLDQPRIYLALSKEPNGKPLAAKGAAGGDILAGLLGEKPDKNAPTEVLAIEAFLDTGASGTMLAKSTADALGLHAASIHGKPITFFDVGVNGREPFAVTEPVFVRQSEYNSNTDGSNLDAYAPAGGPIRLKIRAEGGLLDQLMGALDIAGMPAMAGRVMVVDARPLKDFDKIRTSLLPPGDARIPKTDVSVALSYVNFDRFTAMEPLDAPAVETGANPMIGPNPFDRSDKTQPITVTHKGKTARVTMLLDSGAASSMISTATARALGITIGADGKLTNVPAKEQFTLPIGGIGGAKDINGFFIDVLELPAIAGEPVRFIKAPVLVQDISVTDDKTHEKYTLDGVFGMNYLVASASITTGLAAGVDDIHDGAFSFFVIDHPNKTLRLKLK